MPGIIHLDQDPSGWHKAQIGFLWSLLPALLALGPGLPFFTHE